LEYVKNTSGMVRDFFEIRGVGESGGAIFGDFGSDSEMVGGKN
jgi:hypothetical protein